VTLVFKSAMEYEMSGFYGSPVFIIESDEKGLYYLKRLNLKTKEYETIREGKNFYKKGLDIPVF